MSKKSPHLLDQIKAEMIKIKNKARDQQEQFIKEMEKLGIVGNLTEHPAPPTHPAPRPEGKDQDPTEPGDYATYADLARRHDLNKETLRKALERWELSDPGAKARGDIITRPDRRKNEPKCIYKISAVKHIIDKLKASNPRPTPKKN